MWETKAVLSRTAVSDRRDSKNYCTTGLVKSFVSGLKSRCFPMMTAPKARSKYHWQKNLKMGMTGAPLNQLTMMKGGYLHLPKHIAIKK